MILEMRSRHLVRSLFISDSLRRITCHPAVVRYLSFILSKSLRWREECQYVPSVSMITRGDNKAKSHRYFPILYSCSKGKDNSVNAVAIACSMDVTR